MLNRLPLFFLLAVVAGACATAPTRPALLESPVGGVLAEVPELTDTDADDGVVDVTLPPPTPSGLAIARAKVGDAVVLRGLGGGGGFQQVGPDRVGFDDDVALLNVHRAGVFPIRSGAAARPAAVLIVTDAQTPTPERVLLLDDEAQGVERLNGLGNQLVVNGQARPTLQVASGSAERWHLVNVAERRVFLVALPGHLLIGPDGQESGEVALAPGESATVDVMLNLPAGSTVDLTTIDGDATIADTAEAWPILRVLYVPQKPEKS